MAYFPDLSPYAYGHRSHPGVVHVGWLDSGHEYPRGKVPSHLIEKMREMAIWPEETYLGHHVCNLCPIPTELEAVCDQALWVERGGTPWGWEDKRREELSRWERERSGNGEIRVSRNGVTYAAPVLMVHYIREHGYLPPREFLLAVDEETRKPQYTPPAEYLEACAEAPGFAWAAILEILQHEFTPKQLSWVAAAPVETLLSHHGPAFIERFEREARQNPRFHHLLGGVCRSRMSQDVWDRLRRARGEQI